MDRLEGHSVVVTQLQALHNQNMGYLIRTGDHLIAIDGGWQDEAGIVREKIKENGGKVDAWILTHPHLDHVDAVTEILRSPEGITVDRVYCSLPDTEWIDRYEPEYMQSIHKLRPVLKDYPAVTDLKSGDLFVIAGIHFKVLNAYNPNLITNAINNSSVVLKMECKKDSILFLADAGVEAGRLMMRKYARELRSPIVQMAHHGQNGVEPGVYRQISPQVCLWPCSEWLWNNDSGSGIGSGPWKTLETRKWMDLFHVKTHYVSYQALYSIGID